MNRFIKSAALNEDVKLYPHQERAVNRPGDSLVIAHTTGAGKTLTGIARFEKLKEEGKANKALVIAPSSLRHNFAEQGVNRFTNSKAQVVGGSAERKKGVNNAVDPNADYNILSYEMFRRDPEGYLKNTGADTIIADEFHKNKNEGTSTTDSLKQVKGQYNNFIGLTGSVISNSVNDVQPLIDISTGGDHRLGDSKKDFDNTYLKRSNSKKYKGLAENRKPVTGFKREQTLRNELGDVVDYVDYDDIKELAKMPDKVIQEHKIPLSREEARDYKKLVKNDPALLKMVTNRRLETLKDDELARSFNKMIEARKLMNSRATVHPDMSLSESARSTTKTNRFLDDLEEHLEETPDAQAALFSHMIHGGHDVLEQGLKDRGIEYGKFLGKAKANEVTEESRQQAVRDYLEGKKRVMLISSAGGEGLSLNNTTYEGVLDGHYNPEKMNQMEARGVRSGGLAHRDPEDRQVEINRYIATMPKTLGLFKSKIQTPDEMVYSIAANKDRNNQMLYNLLKEEQRKREMTDNVNQFLGKQASDDKLNAYLDEPHRQDRVYMGKEDELKKARLEASQYPNGHKERGIGLGLAVGGGMAAGAYGANKLFKGKGGVPGAMVGGITGLAGLSGVGSPIIERHLDKKYPGRAEAQQKVYRLYGELEDAEDDFYTSNRFLGKQASLLEEVDRRATAFENAMDEYDQYPSGFKEHAGALAGMTGAGAGLGALAIPKLSQGLGTKGTGAVLGGAAGLAGYLTKGAPMVTERLNTQNPGRVEAKEKMRVTGEAAYEAAQDYLQEVKEQNRFLSKQASDESDGLSNLTLANGALGVGLGGLGGYATGSSRGYSQAEPRVTEEIKEMLAEKYKDFISPRDYQESQEQTKILGEEYERVRKEINRLDPTDPKWEVKNEFLIKRLQQVGEEQNKANAYIANFNDMVRSDLNSPSVKKYRADAIHKAKLAKGIPYGVAGAAAGGALLGGLNHWAEKQASDHNYIERKAEKRLSKNQDGNYSVPGATIGGAALGSVGGLVALDEVTNFMDIDPKFKPVRRSVLGGAALGAGAFGLAAHHLNKEKELQKQANEGGNEMNRFLSKTAGNIEEELLDQEGLDMEEGRNIPLGMGLLGASVGAYPGMVGGAAAAESAASLAGRKIGENRARKTLENLEHSFHARGINPRQLIESAGNGTAQRYLYRAGTPGMVAGATLGAAALGGTGYVMGKGIESMQQEKQASANQFLSKQANQEVYQAIQAAEDRNVARLKYEEMLKEEARREEEESEAIGAFGGLGLAAGGLLGAYVPARALGTHTPLRAGATLTGAAVGGLAGLIGGAAFGDKLNMGELEQFRQEQLVPAQQNLARLEAEFQGRMKERPQG